MNFLFGIEPLRWLRKPDDCLSGAIDKIKSDLKTEAASFLENGKLSSLGVLSTAARVFGYSVDDIPNLQKFAIALGGGSKNIFNHVTGSSAIPGGRLIFDSTYSGGRMFGILNTFSNVMQSPSGMFKKLTNKITDKLVDIIDGSKSAIKRTLASVALFSLDWYLAYGEQILFSVVDGGGNLIPLIFATADYLVDGKAWQWYNTYDHTPWSLNAEYGHS